VRCPVRTTATQPADAETKVQVVLGSGDPATRYRFVVDTGGTKNGYRLTRDQSQIIESADWRGAAQSSEAEVLAEFALPRGCYHHETLNETDTWSLIVRSESSTEPEPNPSTSPMYWLLDSLRGCRADLHRVGSVHPKQRVIRFANAMFQPGLGALQWDLSRIDFPPGARIEIPIMFRPVESAGTIHQSITLPQARLIAPAQSTQSPRVVWDETDVHGVGPVRRGRVIVEPQNAAGLYEISLQIEDAPPLAETFSWPIWVTQEASKTARQYLLAKRDQVDRLAATSWHKSIAAAHVTKALALLEAADGLDGRLIRSLAGMETALAAVQRNDPPHIPTGVSKLLLEVKKRPMEITIDVPAHYDDTLAWPVYWGQPGLPNLIGVSGIWTAEQMTSRPLLDQSLHIDPDLCYMLAWCEQAYFLTDVLVQRPESWAAAVLALRARWSDRAGNAVNVPMRFYNHDRDGPDVLVMQTAAQWMRRQGCQVEYVTHSDLPHTAMPPAYLPEVARWLLQHRRSAVPETVCCTVADPAERSKYWITVDAVAEPRRPAELWATIEEDRIDIQTNGNVRNYTLALDQSPLPPDMRMLRVIEDGQKVGSVSTDNHPLQFRRLPPEDNGNPPYRKGSSLAGPIAPALQSRRFLNVSGESGDNIRLRDGRQRIAARIAAANWFTTEPLVLSDLHLTDERTRSADVLLIGDPATDPRIRRQFDQLGIEMNDQGVRIGERRLAGSDLAVLALGPNPLNDEYYLLVLAGINEESVARAARMLVEQRPPIDDSDCVVVGPAGNKGQPTVLWAEQFDWNWRPVSDREVLAHLKRPHPAWQWAQLVAAVAREQTGADGFFVSRLLRFSPTNLVGPITAHDLYCLVYNDWLVLARMSPSVLRGLAAKAMRYSPQAVVGGLFEVDASRSGTGIRWSSKIAGGAVAPVLIATTPVCEAPTVGTRGARDCVHLNARSCELLPLYTAEALVSFLRQNPQIDLDALLDQQPEPPSPGSIEAITALEEKAPL
jgi:hypothetical protein